jgi:hypothetical protein
MGRLTPRTQRLVRSARLLGLLAAGGLLCLFVLAQSVAGVDPSASPSFDPSASASFLPLATPAASPTPVVLDVPLASPTASPPPLLPIPAVPGVIVHPGDGQSNTCYTCHTAVNDKQHGIAAQWQDSVHGKAGVGCADCHGGDPTSDEITVAMSANAGFIGKPDRNTSVGVCGSCHSDATRMRQYGLNTDQFTKYYASVHGQRLLVNDTRVAICIDCHGSHGIKKASDPTAAVFPLNVPKLCSTCHSDPKLMASYGIPTNQYAIYQTSIHGKQLLEKQDMRAPTCASCHGSHDAKPPQSGEVAQVCGKCHSATEKLYEESRHSKLPGVGPICLTCHGAHDVVLPDESRFFHPTQPKYDCTTCHDPTTRDLRLQPDRFKLDADRRCDSCHHSSSQLYAQAQGIYTSLQKASAAYTLAESRIKDAAAVGMLVTDAEVQLTEANTSLIQARAAVHTTKLAVIASLADAAAAKSTEVQQLADAKLQENLFRREAMVVVVGIVLFNVAMLYLLKRRIHRRTP